MSRDLDEAILALIADIQDAEARLAAATDHWAEKQKAYIEATEQVDDPKALNGYQLAALVGYEGVVDALAFKGVMLVKLGILKRQRAEAYAAGKKTPRRRRSGDASGLEAA